MYCLSSLETRCHAEAHTCDNSDCPETGLAVQKEELPVDSGRTVPGYPHPAVCSSAHYKILGVASYSAVSPCGE